ncbi:hypothetical protein PC123_g3454 [Phytophthora cactorum]|nr:hypothetical protein PC123_g3454 [Phytophthora cactorum]
MGKQRAKYGDKELDDAVQAVLAGAQLKATSKERNIAHSTLKKYVAAARMNAPLEANRRGPPPMLPKSSEDSIRDWILERQVSGHPVGRRDVIRKEQQIAELVCSVPVVEGWLWRFMERHPSLSLRKSQSITKARNEVEESDLSVLFSSLAKVIIENKMGAARVFNVDETAIETKREHKKVVVTNGSKNVWHRDIKTQFHLSFVACRSANGYVIPPLFIFPGESVSEDVFGTCQIPGAGVTTTEKAFMTGSLFARWLRFFFLVMPFLHQFRDRCCF